MGEHLGNMRSALEWAFNSGRECEAVRRLAVEVAASSVLIFIELSLLTECHRWSVAGLAMLDEQSRGSAEEMVLQEAMAISATWALANHESARDALTRAVEIAQQLGDTARRLKLLVGLHIFLMRVGEIADSLAVAEDFAASVQSAADPAYRAVAHCLLGGSHHFLGHQAAAREHLEAGLGLQNPLDLRLFGLDTRLRATVTFGRVLWVSGFPDRAAARAREALALAASSNQPLSVCFSYLYTAPLFLWCGDLVAARQVVEKLMAHPNWHALPSLHATGFALLGAIQIREGQVQQGIERVRSAVVSQRADRQNLLLANGVLTLANGLAAIGQFDEALAVVEEAIANTHEGAEVSHLPELLRVRGEILFRRPQPDEAGADAVLERALGVACQQGAVSWELRIAMTLMRLRLQQGRACEGRQLLAPVYVRFSEGFETPDLQEANQLLKTAI
jgi:predicted ATPase